MDNTNQTAKKEHNIFKQKERPVPGPSSDTLDQMNRLSIRLRTLEGRYTDIRTKDQVIEENMINNHKRMINETKTINLEIRELKKDMQEIKERIMSLIYELKSCAKKEEVKILQKYVNLWNPLKFVTRNEVQEIIEELSKNKQ